MQPVDLQSDGTFIGIAVDEMDALRIAREIYSGSEWDHGSIAVSQSDREIGSTYETREAIERAYTNEIDQGWAQPQQVYAGWKMRGYYWSISARETQG